MSSTDSSTFYEKSGFYADDDIFKIFTFNFLEGDPSKALSAPYSVVITQELAKKYFPGQDPFGKMIKASKNKYLKITGVISDLPFNLNLRPDYLVSISTLREVSDWKSYCDLRNIDAAAFQNYVLLKPTASVKWVDDKIYNLIGHYNQENAYKKLYLKPLSEIHLSAEEDNDYKTALFYLAGTAFFVLVLASINFINLSHSKF